MTIEELLEKRKNYQVLGYYWYKYSKTTPSVLVRIEHGGKELGVRFKEGYFPVKLTDIPAGAEFSPTAHIGKGELGETIDYNLFEGN